MSVETITICDSASGAEAKILVGFGFNCYQFRIPHDGETIDVIWSEPGFDSGEKRASGSGNPILFPYPGRIRGKTLNWEGGAYPLEGDDRHGNAIHGFVHTRPWRVLERMEHRVVGQFQPSEDDPKLLNCWPADFRVTAAYELSGAMLTVTFAVENPDRVPLPCGLGLHPYFCVPLGGHNADECQVQLPVSQRWELAAMLPTGNLSSVENPDAYRAGLSFGDMAFDDVFSGLLYEGGVCTCRVIDPHSGRTLFVEFDDAFGHCVVYNPPHREAVCIEPYTCVPNAIELSAAGVQTGLRILQPGESFQARLAIRLE
jgi:aldose 1-epimerase